MARQIEAYIGEYAAGKSEVAINRALALRKQKEKVTLVDLDLVEPAYTLRPLKKKLEALGLEVIAWETAETQGLGEAGMTLHPQAKQVLMCEGPVLLDLGYGVAGSEVLNLVEDLPAHPDLQVWMVVNLARPVTSSVDAIVAEAEALPKLDGLINNTHLGWETTPELVQTGAIQVDLAAKRLGISVIATSALAPIAHLLGPVDCKGHPVWPLTRFMVNAFW